jgi:type II secretory pathway pseudopilin PulG
VTLVEMLVVVALVILMMVILVQIFQQATGAMTSVRQIQDLDLSLRQLDQRIKQDLIGATAKFTPPLDPTLKLGYFEYGENAFADIQGEDTDDYLAFTTKAPEGQVFTGRVYITNPTTGNNAGHASNLAIQPITITSQLAEVIYFLRNGNLYRRVFLIAPERQGSIFNGNPVNATGYRSAFAFPALLPGAQVSWLGANDLSARPSGTGPNNYVILNDLGDLTNRENRAFRPRFHTDFFNASGQAFPDYNDDDLNHDDIPDLYPTLYPNAISAGLVNELGTTTTSSYRPTGTISYDVMAFPYIFPGMYSHPETVAPYSLATGWVHSLDPSHTTYKTANPFTGVAPNLYTGNHAPLITGDIAAWTPSSVLANGQCQTWYGFPTWRETLSVNWRDPNYGLSLGSTPTQQLGLRPIPPGTTTFPVAGYPYLPPVTSQYANDGAGSTTFSAYVPSATNAVPGVWDDDLICTNVRRFDVKAFDPAAPLYSGGGVSLPAGYYDLGYGVMLNSGLMTATPNTLWDSSNQPQGFGHTGRIPPLVNDLRLSPSRPNILGGVNNNNVGDNGNNLPVIRLNRVWDSWSTDYTNAPGVDIFYDGYPGNLATPSGTDKPVYPSFPAPYNSPLRGIQIKIRVNDPRSEYPKDLTIKHDFTDKL